MVDSEKRKRLRPQRRNSDPERFEYITPLWGIRLVLVVMLAFSAAAFTLFYLSLEHTDTPVVVRWFLPVLGVVFLLIALRRDNWQRWLHFEADREGLHFPDDARVAADTTWFSVPWERVGEIRVERFYGGTRGPLFELALTEDEIYAHFRNTALTKRFHGAEVLRDGYFSVGFSNAFDRPEKSVERLRELQRRFGTNLHCA